MSAHPNPVHQIDVSIDEQFAGEVSEAWLRSVVEVGLDAAVMQLSGVQVSLLLTDDSMLRDLNLQFRGLDEVTDVLSFSMDHPGHWEGESNEPNDRFQKPGETDEFAWSLPPGELPPLGEVVVSYPQASRQAAEHGQPVDRELAHLIVHGLLHLAGHDHEEPEEQARMQALERTGMEAVFQAGKARS